MCGIWEILCNHSNCIFYFKKLDGDRLNYVNLTLQERFVFFMVF